MGPWEFSTPWRVNSGQTWHGLGRKSRGYDFGWPENFDRGACLVWLAVEQVTGLAGQGLVWQAPKKARQPSCQYKRRGVAERVSRPYAGQVARTQAACQASGRARSKIGVLAIFSLSSLTIKIAQHVSTVV